MNLTKRLSLSFVAIVLVLFALLMAARALAPTPGPELPSTDEDLPPNLLSGTVTGLDPGDNVRLHLEHLAEGGADGRGEIVKGFDVANGRWQQPGLALTPGYYRLIPEAKGYVQIPQSIVLQVPEESIVWRYTSLSFDFLHPEDAPARLGLPLCPEPAPHVAVTAASEGTPSPTPQSDLVQSGPPGPPSDLCYANHLAAVRLVPAGLQGHISGLPDGQMATIALYALPPVPGESYGQGEPPPMDSSWVYPPEVASLTEPPEIAPDWPLTVTLVVGNGHWGLVDPSLVGGKYLVVAYAHGQTVVPRAYEVVIFAGKAPGFPGGVEFAFDPEPQGAPSNETPAAPETPPAPPPPKPMLTPMTEPTPAPTSPSAPTLADLVLQPDGLGMADFGDDSDAVIASLSGILGAPDFDSGCRTHRFRPVNPCGPAAREPAHDCRTGTSPARASS